MSTIPAPARDRAAVRAQLWSRVQHVVGPLEGDAAVEPLYLRGARLGAALGTPTGRRHRIEIPAAATADFGTYFNAFPAAYWRHHVGSKVVRLEVRVDRPAAIAVHRSDETGAERVVERRALVPDEGTVVDVRIDGADRGGLVWFTLTASADPVVILDAAWSVDQAPRTGGRLVAGMPTLGQAAAVARNLDRIGDAPALLAVLARFVLVDQGERDLAADLAPGLAGLGDRAQLIRQHNLGGSGGFSRVLHEATDAPGAAFVALMDDDIALEPASLLRAYEFARRCRRPTVVGTQMLDAAAPTVLDAGPETVSRGTFWWHGVDPDLDRLDLAAAPMSAVPALHRRHEAGYAGWWTCLIPTETVTRVGYALPMFLKWDDAEYGLRAVAAGADVVTPPGVAIWHESWRSKDDTRGWIALLHARNRFVAAMLHGGTARGLVASSLAHEVKQLLALQYFAVEARHEGLSQVLMGPDALAADFTPLLTRLRERAAAAPEQRRRPVAELPPVPVVPVGPAAPLAAPTGRRLVVWAARSVARHWISPSPDAAAPVSLRLGAGRAGWWVAAAGDVLAVPSADGAAWFLDRRDRVRFRRLLVASVRLHLRLLRAWPRLTARYGATAAPLASPEAWTERFAAAAR